MDKFLTITQIETNLISPPREYRPFVRWWWFGSAVTRDEITRELSELHNAGFGGVEIQPIFSAQAGHPILNAPDIPWLSPKWVEMVEFTCQEAKKQDIQVDMTFGNGWPFGGPYITKNFASARLTGCSMPLEPHSNEIDITDFLDQFELLVAVVAINVKSADPLQDTVNLKPYLKEDHKIHWIVPEGEWLFYLFHLTPTGQTVKRAAPGGQGLVLDHLNRKAFDQHATKIDDALTTRFGTTMGEYFGAFFCDSWEVYGENWTRSLLSEFKARMGYDLSTFLPVMIKGFFMSNNNPLFTPPPINVPHEILNNVIYDYRNFHGELIIDNFFGPFVDYCHSRGVQCRVQPYVAPTDLLRVYGLLDILEIEGFGSRGIGTNYYGEIDPRMASSSAHIYGKSWVSCESFTWLGEHFSVPLEQIKHEADQIILHGIHRIIYHGCPYSPQEAGIPGWVFYAANQVNPQNTWWPYIGQLNQYITRNAFLGHQGVNVADFAVYRPLHDEWMGKSQHLIHLRDALRNHGWLNEFDYVNDDRLVQAAHVTIESNIPSIQIGDGHYFALIIWATEYIPLLTAKHIQNLIAQGGRVIFIRNYPRAAPGLRAVQNGESNQVAEIFTQIQNNAILHPSNVVLLPDFERLDPYLSECKYIPDVEMQPPQESVRHLHRRISDGDLYFLVNGSAKEIELTFTFRTHGSLMIWKPIENRFYRNVRLDNLHVKVPLSFQPFESYWIFIDNNAITTTSLVLQTQIPLLMRTVPPSWDITFQRPANPFPSEPAWSRTFTQTNLFDWAKDPEVSNFAGTSHYRTPVEITATEIEKCTIQLDLGEVHEIAEVFLNGMKIDVLWQGNRICDISSAAKPGSNDLEIRVTNLLINRVLDYEQKKIKWRPDYYFVNIEYEPFNTKLLQPLPSGLLGPVQIIFYEKKP